MRTLFVCVLVGCGSEAGSLPPPPTPEWQLDITPRHGVTFAAAEDGSFVGLVGSWGVPRVQIGDASIDAPAFVRVSAAGEIVTTAPIVMAVMGGVGSFLGLTRDGGPVIAVGAYNSMTSWVAAFDAAFTPAWDVKTDMSQRFGVSRGAVGPDGAVVFLARLETAGGLLANNAVRYIASGTVQWRVPVNDQYFGEMWFADSGDVVLCERDSRSRYTAAGVLIDSTSFPCSFSLAGHNWGVHLRDGGAVYMNSETIVRVDVGGRVVWSRAAGSWTESFFETASGDLLAITSEASQVARINGATGKPIASHSNTNAGFFEFSEETHSTIVAGDAEGYVLLQPSGLARYAGP